MAFSSIHFLAQTEAAPPGGGALQFAFPVLLIVMFYFMLIRPQRRQQKEHQAKLAALRSGDEVIAAGGIHGLITNVSERTVTLKIADGVKIKIEKSAVLSITKKEDAPVEAVLESAGTEAKS